MPFRRTLVAAIAAAAILVTAHSTASADPEPTAEDVHAAMEAVEQASEAVNALDVEIADLQTKLKNHRADAARTLDDYETVRDSLVGAIVQDQIDNPLGHTAALLSSPDADQFMEDLATVQLTGQIQTEAMDQLLDLKAVYDNNAAAVTETLDEIAAKREAAEAERARLDAIYQEAKAERERLDAEQAARLLSLEGGPAFDPSSIPPVEASERAQAAIDFALAQIGDPYVWGGNGPDVWDCSGLTKGAMSAAGVSIPRVASDQYHSSKKVSLSELQPGDLVFKANLSHVGLYIGNGLVVHAPRTGKNVEIMSVGWYDMGGRYLG